MRGPLLVAEPPPAPPDVGELGEPIESDTAFHRDAVELRFVESTWQVPGRRDVGPAPRAGGGGVDGVAAPAGEWIGLRCRTDLGNQGVGLAESSLYDADGRFGRAEQSLFVDTR